MRQIVRLQRRRRLRARSRRTSAITAEKIDYEWDGGAPVGRDAVFAGARGAARARARAGGRRSTQRHRDIARSVQAMYEEAFFHLLNAPA